MNPLLNVPQLQLHMRTSLKQHLHLSLSLSHTHTHKHTHVHKHTHYKHTYTYMHKNMHTYTCMQTYVQTHTHTHTCMCNHMHICMCMCTHAHTHSHSHTHTHTSTQTYRAYGMYDREYQVRARNCSTQQIKARTGIFTCTPQTTTKTYSPATENGSCCCWLVAYTSQKHASVSKGPICSDSCMCCHTVAEVDDHTCYLTKSQYTDTGPTHSRADTVAPGAWKSNHWSIN